MTAYFNPALPVVRVGDRVRFRNCVGASEEAGVTGFGRKNGSRVVLLDNGGWCYEYHLEVIVRVADARLNAEPTD